MRDLFVMNAAGGTPEVVLADGLDKQTPVLSPSWAPDGTQLAFGGVAENQDIMVINADGTGLRNLTQTPGDAGEIQPVWSPDGAYIAFTGYRGGNQEIVRRKIDGTGEVVLTNLGAEDQHPSWSRTP